MVARIYSTTEEMDVLAVTSFVCKLYGYKTSIILEARYKAFMWMSGCTGKDLLVRNKEDKLCFSATIILYYMCQLSNSLIQRMHGYSDDSCYEEI